jgi:uncharacterized protein YciI
VAHKLGLKTIAEGVETEAQHQLLLSFGCDFAQGYLYSKPVPVKEFEKLIALAEHREFLSRRYASGHFLLSGRKEPRSGGVILATGTRPEIEHIVKEDPFYREKIAEYEIVEFLSTKSAESLLGFVAI